MQKSREEIHQAFLAMIGQPYEAEGSNGCLRLVQKAYRIAGIELTLDHAAELANFSPVSTPDFLDIVHFKGLTVQGLIREDDHLGVMLDKRRCLQSSYASNGVGVVSISSPFLAPSLRGFYRHNSLMTEKQGTEIRNVEKTKI